MERLDFTFKINEIDKKLKDFSKLDNKKINLINVEYKFKKCFEKITSKSNAYINETFAVALKIIKRNNFSKFVNGPISKKHFLKGKTLGITEYLFQKTRADNAVMLIFNDKLSVSPITTHLALKDVPKNISSKKIYRNIIIIDQFYKKNFNKRPKIAITGLNPHCESNFNNSEEDSIISPAIKKLKKQNLIVKGPFPADTIFLEGNSRKFDVIVGMYHDQVLTPMKALFGFNAINVTLGLPFIRLSPDHGPNSFMLGKNLSNPKSLINALKFLDK